MQKYTGLPLRILVAGKRYNITGGYFERGSICIKDSHRLVNGKFSDLLMPNEHPECIAPSFVHLNVNHYLFYKNT